MGIFIMKNQKTKQERFDYFAGLAMQSFIATTKENVGNFDEMEIKVICFVAREFAKEMIEQIDENEQI
jgi:hypothetical protein